MATAVKEALHCEAMACHLSSVDLVVGSHLVRAVVSAVAHLEGSETAADIPSRCDAQAADPRRGCDCDCGCDDEEPVVVEALDRIDVEAAQGTHSFGARMMAVGDHIHA